MWLSLVPEVSLRLQKGILQKSLLGFLSSSVADCNFVPFSSLFLPFYYGFSQKEQMVHFLFYFNLESFLASLSLRAPSLIFLSPLRLVCKSCFSSACFGPGSESLCCVVHLGVIWCRCWNATFLFLGLSSASIWWNSWPPHKAPDSPASAWPGVLCSIHRGAAWTQLPALSAEGGGRGKRKQNAEFQGPRKVV